MLEMIRSAMVPGPLTDTVRLVPADRLRLRWTIRGGRLMGRWETGLRDSLDDGGVRAR